MKRCRHLQSFRAPGASSPAPASPASSPGSGPCGYLAGRLTRWQRVLVGAVGGALLPVMFLPVLPIWRIFLVAPQYREGLQLLIFADNLTGDLRNINILNHYIGMKQITPDSFPEFGYMPAVISLCGLAALAAAVVGRRWLAFLGWLGFAAFGTVMMLHFAAWMKDYGTNLDPHAALDFGSFIPPLVGTAKRGNFVIRSYPHAGGYILLAAGALGPVLAALDLWSRRRRARAGGPGLSLPQGVLPAGFLFAVLVLAAAGAVQAADFVDYRQPPDVSPLQPLVESTPVGGVLVLPEGVYRGQLVIGKALTVEGPASAVLDGEGRGTVVVVKAAGVTLRGFCVRNSGYELLLDDAGILVDEADDAVLEGLILQDNNHGIYVRNALRPVVTGCRIEGRSGKVAEENHGNGVHVWYAKDARVAENDIAGHRDGIYLSFAEAAVVTMNVFHHQDRFGLHSMYSQRNIIQDNLFTRNTAGVALMFSNRMRMEGNLFAHNRGHRTYGLLLRDCSDSLFLHNRLVDNTIGLFLDGSNRNRFQENLVAENGWGAIAYSSSEDNVFTRNTFLGNDYQMSLDMRRTHNLLHDDGVGNFWNDARPYDLDADGLGDAPYCPVGLFAFVSKQFPDLTVFAGSPAVLALDAAQRSLPVLQMTDLSDPHPLMQPALIPAYRGPAPAEAAPVPDAGHGPLVAASLFCAACGLALRRTGR